MPHELPMAPTGGGEINCSNCTAACCRGGMAMPMTAHEAYTHRRKMALQMVVKPRTSAQTLTARVVDPEGRPTEETETIELPRNTGLYLLIQDCGYLDGNICTIYDQANKPKVCAEFEVASAACISVRAGRGVPAPES